MKNRSEAREAALKILYKIDILETAKVEIKLDELIREECEIQNDFVNFLIEGVLQHKIALDRLANKYLIDWQIARLNKVDQAIFRIGIFELQYTDTPSIVAINEAIELSKKYSDEAVTKMLNGVLDKIYHDEENRHE